VAVWQAQAERLSAALLHLEGYVDIDPQCPLGGPDGLKDAICRRDDRKWIAAAYFPPTESTPSEISKKFNHDLPGVRANGAQGILFLTNQRIGPAARDDLLEYARKDGATAEIYHLERIRAALDAPKGYGIRLEYLRIPMTEEEQVSFFSELNYDVTRRLLDNQAQFASLHAKLDLVLKRTEAIGSPASPGPSSVLSSTSETTNEVENPTSVLSIANISWIHRIVTEGSGVPETSRGRLRSIAVHITGSSLEPRPADAVPGALRDLIVWWRKVHPILIGKDKQAVVAALADLHHRFLSIHPFIDANGRVARVLLDQAARELLGRRIGPDFLADPSLYFRALEAADAGEMEPLTRLVEAALE